MYWKLFELPWGEEKKINTSAWSQVAETLWLKQKKAKPRNKLFQWRRSMRHRQVKLGLWFAGTSAATRVERCITILLLLLLLQFFFDVHDGFEAARSFRQTQNVLVGAKCVPSRPIDVGYGTEGLRAAQIRASKVVVSAVRW